MGAESQIIHQPLPADDPTQRKPVIDLAIVHNHPSTQTLSLQDVNLFLSNASIRVSVVVSNQGTVHYLRKDKDYRRMLEFSQDDLLRLVDNDADVILPYPMPYEPNIHAHHERYLADVDWNALLQALEELSPDYYTIKLLAIFGR